MLELVFLLFDMHFFSLVGDVLIDLEYLVCVCVLMVGLVDFFLRLSAIVATTINSSPTSQC